MVIAPKEYKGKKYSKNRILEHHLVYWKNTGKYVLNKFNIHHINGIKDDNRFENLELISLRNHVKLHRPKLFISYKCKLCNKIHKCKPNKFRYHKKVNKLGLFCSKSCATKYQYSGFF